MRKLLFAAIVASLLALTAPPASAHFLVKCSYSHSLMDDPIVLPQQPGLSHLHDFLGSRTTDAFSTYDSMIASPTTCSLSADTAGYWAPAVFKDGVQVPAAFAFVYYRPPMLNMDLTTIRAFPPDLRMVAGGDTIGNPLIAYWSCNDDPATRTPYPPADCGRKRLRVNVIFPSCWDGVNLDPPDHRSHMAYPTTEGCPADHPVPVPKVGIHIVYPLHKGTGITLASGEATTAHADFWNTWDQATLEAEVARCINIKVNCGKLRD